MTSPPPYTGPATSAKPRPKKTIQPGLANKGSVQTNASHKPRKPRSILLWANHSHHRRPLSVVHEREGLRAPERRFVPVPLTPALSPEERENPDKSGQIFEVPDASGCHESDARVPSP